MFAGKRNDPCEKALSNVSPWLHYGQIAAQRCALEAKRLKKNHSASVDSFLEVLPPNPNPCELAILLCVVHVN